MTQGNLNEQIRTLTSALDRIRSVDAETSALLAALQEQLTRIAENHGDASVKDRLEAMAVRFEADHPSVGAALRQAADTLSKAGI
jgi:hypothetical protein